MKNTYQCDTCKHNGGVKDSRDYIMWVYCVTRDKDIGVLPQCDARKQCEYYDAR